MSVTIALSLLVDAALGGLAVASAFQKFQKDRPGDETPQQAAEAFAREMLAQAAGEAAADEALAAYRARRDSGAR